MLPDLREGDLADRRSGAAGEELLMVLFVHRLADVGELVAVERRAVERDHAPSWCGVVSAMT
jgi:hypothetical protein